MERNEFKKILIALGIKEELTEMPAVVEPLYVELMNKSEKEILESGDITVFPTGNFAIGEKMVSIEVDGTVMITTPEAIIEVNKYGIEFGNSEGNWMGPFSDFTRQDATIKHSYGDNKNASWHENITLDNGSWEIKKARGMKISEKDFSCSDIFSIDSKTIDVDAILAEFEKTASFIESQYPKTKGWYDMQRVVLQNKITKTLGISTFQTSRAETSLNSQDENKGQIVKEMSFQDENMEQTEKNTNLEEKIKQLETENKNLHEKNGRLMTQNERLIEMLDKALKFIERIKSSPVARLFFRKDIKEYEKEAKRLDKGREEK